MSRFVAFLIGVAVAVAAYYLIDYLIAKKLDIQDSDFESASISINFMQLAIQVLTLAFVAGIAGILLLS